MITEWCVLADYASVHDSKLFLQGGGWSSVYLPVQQPGLSFAFATSFMIGWNETNVKHPVVLSCSDADGKCLVELKWSVLMGRDNNLEYGTDQRLIHADVLHFATIADGSYTLEIASGESSVRTSFRVQRMRA